MYNFLVYLIVMVIVIWSMEGVNINRIYKANHIYQARAFYIILVFSLTYLTSNFIIEFLNSLK